MLSLWNSDPNQGFSNITVPTCTECGGASAEVGGLCLECYDKYVEKIKGGLK